MLERIGSAALAEQTTTVDRPTLLWLWFGWAISALLGFLAPLYRGTTHIHAGVVVGTAVFVIIGVAAATRRPMVCLTMSAFGLTAGAALGFGLLAALTHRPLTFAITVQTIIGAVFLGRIFRRELRPKPPLPEDTFWEDLKSLSEEQAKELAIARMTDLHREMTEVTQSLKRMGKGNNRMLLGAAVAIPCGLAVLLTDRTTYADQVMVFAFPIAVVGFVLVSTGAWINWRVKLEYEAANRNSKERR